MESASYVSKPDARVKLGEAVRMVMVKDKFVVDSGLPSLFVASRRAYFFNRRPTVVVALTRRGSKEDCECEFEVSGLFSTYESDVALVVGRKGELALLDVKTSLTEGTTAVSKITGSVPVEVVAAAFIGASSETVVLLANGAVLRLSADLKTQTELRKETPIKGTFIATHGDYVLVPSKDAVDVISFATKKSALSSAWVPHSQGEPIIAAHIFKSWKPTANGSNVVMTVGAGGREVRLWTGLGNAGFELAANLSLELPKDSGIKRVAVADKEENVIITFDTAVIVLSTDERKVRFSRATEWEAADPAGPFCAYNETTKAGVYQLSMVTRSVDCIAAVKLPPSIFGDANLGSAAANGGASSGSAAPAATHEREANYFASAVHKDTGSSVVVSSSLSPATAGADAGLAEKTSAAAIATIAAEAVRKISSVKNNATAVQNDVTAFIGSLQSPAVQAASAKQGKEYAIRNATRFTSNNVAAASPPSAGASPSTATATAAGRNVEQLGLICDFMQSAVKTAITARAESNLAPKVKAAVEANGGEADVADLPLPKLTSVPQMQQFNANIDKALKAQTDYLKAEADSRASTYNAQVVRSSTATRQAIAESRKFLADLKAELSGLTKDIEAVKVELAASLSADRNTIGAVSSVNAVEDAVALVEKKEYESAVTKITQAKNFNLLLEFIGHPNVKVASDAGAFAPGSISVPAFGMLVQQLATDIGASKGHIAPRAAWLYTLCVDWDDYIDATQEGSDEMAKGVLSTLAPSMGVARRAIEALNKDDMSIESRRQARTVVRVLAKLE